MKSGGIIEWMVHNPVTANLIMIFLLVGGLLSLGHIRQEVFPEIEIDKVEIIIYYPGASPEEIESGIISPVENAIIGMEGTKKITAIAKENIAVFVVELVEGANRQSIRQDIKDRINSISTLPSDVQEPRVTLMERKRHVISLVLYGDTSTGVLHHTAENIKDTLLADPEITQVELRGIKDYEIAIEVPGENLRRYGITLSKLAEKIRALTAELPGGGIKTGSGEILLRVNEKKDYGREFAELPVITTKEGSVIKLGEMANIKDGYEESYKKTFYNGKPSVEVLVNSIESESPIVVANAVKKKIDIISKALPPGLEIKVQHDSSLNFKHRINLLLKNGVIGLILVILILGLFLEFRLAFWVMLGIPISFLGSLLFLPTMDISINMITLFAYIIALGIVVDDAIVIGENIYHYRNQGMSSIEAAIFGAKELTVPIVFSILTNIVTFIPILLIPGYTGKVFFMIPVIVITVFLISLFESLFILPAHLAHSNVKKRGQIGSVLHEMQQSFSRGFANWVRCKFGAFLSFSLNHRYITMSMSFSILIVALSYALSGKMGFSFMPKVEANYSRATLVMPFGTPAEKTAKYAERLLQSARKTAAQSGSDKLVTGTLIEVGYRGSHNAKIKVFLAAPEIRKEIMSNEEFTRRWRKNTGSIPGMDYIKFESDARGPGYGASISIQMKHRNRETLQLACSELARELGKFPMVKDINEGFQSGKEQLTFKLSTEAKAMGLTPTYVAREIRDAYQGREVKTQQRGRNELKIKLKLPESERKSEYSLRNHVILTPQGKEVYLSDIVKFQRGKAYTEINHANGTRIIEVEADVTPRQRTYEILGEVRGSILPRLVKKYPGLTYSLSGKHARIKESMSSLKTGFIMAMIAIFALLAIPFKSYTQPLIVMVGIPFGVIGAIMGHIILGYSLSVMSMFGIVALSGVVINDTLVLVDMANRLRRNEGMGIAQAIHEAAIQRFRPIVLTTLTTFFGLFPMILETSKQAQFLIPMAVSLAFGILFATVITLLLVPSLYLIMDDIRKFSGLKASSEKQF